MTLKKVIGIILAIIFVICTSLILISQSSLLVFLCAVGLTILVVLFLGLIVWLITD